MADFGLHPVLETPLFTVTPCIDCDVPGYLIVQPRQHETTIAALTTATQVELGPTIARVERAVFSVTQAEHVYILRFSEGLGSVHFHIFPRSQELANFWRRSAGAAAQEGINGPLLFAWARIKYHVDHPKELSTSTLSAAARISDELHCIHCDHS